MAFEEIIGARGPRFIGEAARVAASNGKFACVVTEELAKKLGWARGSRVRLLIGTDGDAGHLRLQPVESGGYSLFRGSARRNHLMFIVRAWDAIAEGSRRSYHAPYRIIGGGILDLDLRGWKATGGGATTPAATAPALSKPLSTGPVHSVTSRLMGDPAPGRSAADQRRAKG